MKKSKLKLNINKDQAHFQVRSQVWGQLPMVLEGPAWNLVVNQVEGPVYWGLRILSANLRLYAKSQ